MADKKEFLDRIYGMATEIGGIVLSTPIPTMNLIYIKNSTKESKHSNLYLITVKEYINYFLIMLREYVDLIEDMEEQLFAELTECNNLRINDLLMRFTTFKSFLAGQK